jgi:hypothetical protein
MLPVTADEPEEALSHLCLHNGTIWRWNRPLIGRAGDGRPQLRLEHRTLPAGPSVVDCICNAALFFGLVNALASLREPVVTRLPFDVAQDNFYAAARDGLDAELGWFDGRRGPAQELFTTLLLPLARQGLERLGIDYADRDDYLEVIEARVRGQRTGCDWQRAWVARHGADMHGLAEAYLAEQASGRPVHEWPGGFPRMQRARAAPRGPGSDAVPARGAARADAVCLAAVARQRGHRPARGPGAASALPTRWRRAAAATQPGAVRRQRRRGP